MRFTVIYLLASLASAQQALVLNTSPAVGDAPNASIYNTPDVRIEARYTGLTPCPSGNAYASNLLILTGLNSGGTPINFMGLGCPVTGQKSLSLANNTGPAMITEAMLTGVTDIIVRAQKVTGSAYYSLEAWKPDGTLIYSGTFATSLSTATYDMRGRQQTIVGGTQGAMGNVAWIRLYSTVKPLQSAMPKDTLPEAPDLGAWEFEGNLKGSKFNLTSAGGRSYVPSVIHPPVLQISASPAVASKPLTLSSDNSFDYVGAGFSAITWQWVSGPARPNIVSPTSRSTSVTNLVEGVHRFQLSGTDVNGQVATTYLNVTATNVDAYNQPIYPIATHKLAGSISVGFNLSSVPNAVDVQVTILKPDGRELAPVICTSSPCAVPVDARQPEHLYKVAYRGADGKVLSPPSDWVRAPRASLEPPVLYDDGEYGWFGTYLPQTGTARDPSP
jgi:hypothetical protein